MALELIYALLVLEFVSTSLWFSCLLRFLLLCRTSSLPLVSRPLYLAPSDSRPPSFDLFRLSLFRIIHSKTLYGMVFTFFFWPTLQKMCRFGVIVISCYISLRDVF